jgi:hypothetical protein
MVRMVLFRVRFVYILIRFILCYNRVMYAVWAPSEIPFSNEYPKPKGATEEYLDYVEKAFIDAVERCKQIGCKSHAPLFVFRSRLINYQTISSKFVPHHPFHFTDWLTQSSPSRVIASWGPWLFLSSIHVPALQHSHRQMGGATPREPSSFRAACRTRCTCGMGQAAFC